ncbi:MAG TPA: RNB domain-containing ribonuclease [Solirubrobacter sp.]|nr:RNB domain-containing ribonuclease [Solirubrobacter sp.]
MRSVRIVPAAGLRDGLEAIRCENDVPEHFPDDVLAEAEAARAPARERVELDFVTIDPPGARDLDQAMHLERRGDGYRVDYAIADPGAFITPGGALDREAHARAVTVYMPDGKIPLHPPVLSEGAASLLPGEWRPAVLWTLDLDARGELVGTQVRRAEVRSVAQLTYEDEQSPLLEEIGERRLALERARGGVRLAVPEQEVIQQDGGWTVRYRAPLPTEEYNAQISLLCGIAAAALMLAAGRGILRTQSPPGEKDLARLRRTAAALAVPWPDGLSYPEWVRTLDPGTPNHAAVIHEASRVGRGAGYTAFDGPPPEDAAHWAVAAPYAHATAPLRRLQDRWVSACCLGETPAGLEALPAAMEAGIRRANAVERAVVDLLEAVLLVGREGERFDAVVIDDGLLQLIHPAVRARLSDGTPPVGTQVSVRLERADPATRTVSFTL